MHISSRKSYNYSKFLIYTKMYRWMIVYSTIVHSCLILTEFIDPVFSKTSPKRSFSMTENQCFGLVFAKNGYINSGTGNVSNTVVFTVIKSRCSLNGIHHAWKQSLNLLLACIPIMEVTNRCTLPTHLPLTEPPFVIVYLFSKHWCAQC
jgi:hypothetical protein